MKKTKIAALVGAVILSATTLFGCNYDLIDTNHTFNKAIVSINNKVVVLDVKQWTDYEGEQLQLILRDGSVILVSSYNTILVNGDENSTIFEAIKENE